jgi:hypothetical protein
MDMHCPVAAPDGFPTRADDPVFQAKIAAHDGFPINGGPDHDSSNNLPGYRSASPE